MKKRIFVLALVGISVLGQALWADETTSDVLNDKLNQVLENQNKIMADLEEIKSELEVVKIRATNR